jgi:hypothetical protein
MSRPELCHVFPCLVLLLASCATQDPNVRCAEIAPRVSAESRTIAAAEAERITTDMTVQTIVGLLGPPRRNRCSGIYCPEWDVADGRVLVVSFTSGCGKPRRVTLH